MQVMCNIPTNLSVNYYPRSQFYTITQSGYSLISGTRGRDFDPCQRKDGAKIKMANGTMIDLSYAWKKEIHPEYLALILSRHIGKNLVTINYINDYDEY
jgi:hypothetical protein